MIYVSDVSVLKKTFNYTLVQVEVVM